MSEFKPAFQFMAPHEWNHFQNYTNTPGDPGGPTKYGVTLKTLSGEGTLYDLNHDGVVNAEDVKLLTEEDAEPFYERRYWNEPKLPLISPQLVASKVFDMGVNLGPQRAIMYLQQVVNSFGGQQLLVDGRMGPATAKLVDSLDPQRVLDGLCAVLAHHYMAWIDHDPHDREKFRTDLLGRAKSLPPEEAA